MAKEARVLAGETAVVTGGARGIGRATASALLGAGMKVAIGDIDGELAEQTARELSATNAFGGPLDVTSRASFQAFLDDVERQLGPIDVLVNNAGIMPLHHFLDEDDDTARRIMDINVHGVILGTKLALERMLPRDHGHIVNIASQAGKIGTPGGATYSASKHAVIGLTESVRGEMRLLGAHVDLSYVMPSVVATELGGGLGATRGVKTAGARRRRRGDRRGAAARHRRRMGAEVGQAPQHLQPAAAPPRGRGDRPRDQGATGCCSTPTPASAPATSCAPRTPSRACRRPPPPRSWRRRPPRTRPRARGETTPRALV